jgi:PAS domain S-box-containing protein
VALAATVVVLAVNIMLRRRAEQQNLRLAAAVAQTSEIVIMLDAAGTVTYINPAFTRVTGCALEAARASLASCLRCPQGPDALARIVAQLRTAGAGSETWECQAPDGATLQLSVVGSSVRDAAGGVTGFILIARDVTREVRLEEQARTSQKMEAVGLLAGGVAHDFNNLLQVITGYTHQAMDSSAPEAERTAGLSQVLAAAERAAQLARQLLAFGRRQPLHMQDTDLNQLVVGFLKMIRRIIGEHLEVRFAPGASLGNVRADPGQLEQVILNLCVNARDAMPQGGTLTLTLDNASLDAEFCQSHPWARPGRYVRLRVTDTGCGMDKKTLSRSFDPFFTTKLPGKGTGLGLAVVYGIVQQHEGCLHVDSEPGRGTSFDIYLPVVATTAPAAPAPAPPASSATAAGTILLVEDDAAVRTLAERILRRAGYQVFLAENGADAVRCFEQHAAEIQLTVMDVVMPKMSGPEAAARMAAIRPGVPVLFCSGYSADALHPGFELRPDVQMLPKPYTPATLLARIAALLAPQPAAPAHPAAP